MAKGNFTGTAASAVLIAANAYRDHLLIQKTNATTVALGIGEAAVAGEGIQLVNAGDVAILHGASARVAIYVIGNGGTGTYQDGDVEVTPGPYISA
jgi:hypothetical protein